MFLYAVLSGEINYDIETDYTIVSVHQTLPGAIKKWKEVKQFARKRYNITNPHYFTVRKIKVQD